METCQRCGGDGVIIVCIDDMCNALGQCIHGDGEELCPECDGCGEIATEEDYDPVTFAGCGAYDVFNPDARCIGTVVMDVDRPPFPQSSDPKYLFEPGYFFWPAGLFGDGDQLEAQGESHEETN